jgi:hypothetical protein
MCVKVAVDPPGAMTQAPATLQQVVMRCLEKAPDDRYASMADLARDLAPFAHDRHQADVLVERAARMLRLSGVQSIVRSPTSSGNSGPIRKPASGEQLAETTPVRAAGSGTAIPLPAGDARSGSATAIPLPAADVATGSGAAIPLSPAELTTAAALPPRAEFRAGSGPAFSETLAVVRQPRRAALWIATVLIAAAGALGAAISLARAPAASRAAAPAATEAKPTESGAPAAAVAAPTAPPAPNGTSAAPSTDTAAAPSTGTGNAAPSTGTAAAPSMGTAAAPSGGDADSTATPGTSDDNPADGAVGPSHGKLPVPSKHRHGGKRPAKSTTLPQQAAPAAAPTPREVVLPKDDPCWNADSHGDACKLKRAALSKGMAVDSPVPSPR